MKRHFARSALVYALCNLVGGLFYRQFTKAFAFEGETTLSVVHTPYFVLGMVFMLALLALEASMSGLAGLGHIPLSVALIGLSSQVLGATKKE